MKRQVLLASAVSLLFVVAVFTTNLPAHASPDQYVSYTVAGASMRPTLELDDWITARTDITVSQIRAAPQPDGDIIVFYRPKASSSDSDTIIVHRAIESVVDSQTGTTFFRTKGDNNANSDSFVSDYRGENYSQNGMISEKLLIGKVVGIGKSSSAGSWNGVTYNVTLYTNSTVTTPDFSQSDRKIQFDTTGYISYSNSGFCNVTIPKGLLNCSSSTDWQVKLNGTNIAYTASENETHTSVYFAYGYSLHRIEIIGTQAITGQQTVSEIPQAVVLGRYNYYDDKYWIVLNKTVQQLRNEGYDVSGDANWLAYANYTNLGYTFKSKIVKFSWPNMTLQLTEGAHDVNVTAYRIMDDGSIGERLGSFLTTSHPSYVHPYPLDVKDPDLGVGFDPAVFTIGNSFPTSFLTYTVQRTEVLAATPWGQNNTYVLQGTFSNATHSYNWTTWCDAESGLFLKIKVESMTPTFTSYEEQNIIETKVEQDKFDVVKDSQSYQVHIDTNSTLNGFTFDSNTNKIDLIVQGATGTSGTCNITVPKNLVPAGDSIEVYIDGQKTPYVLVEDATNYYVAVGYSHSTHTITISFVATALWDQLWFWPAIGAAIVIIVGATYFLKKRTKTQTPSSK